MFLQLFRKNGTYSLATNGHCDIIKSLTYHIAVNGQATGPFDISVLAQMATAGQLNSDSLVWKNGMAQWETAGVVEDLKELFTNVMPPIPQ